MDKKRIGTISSAQFFERLKNNDWKDEGLLEIEGQINFNSDTSISEFTEIRNIYFSNVVTLENIDLQCGIRFVNCFFNKGIKFNNVKSTAYNKKYNINNTNIDFIECQSKWIFISSRSVFFYGILIKNCESIEEVILNNLLIKNIGIIIENSNITELLDVDDSKLSLKISECNDFSGAINLRNSELSISFQENSFYRDIRLWGLKKSKLILNGNTFKDKFEVKACEMSSISIIGDEFNREFNLNLNDQGQKLEGDVDEFYCSEVKFLEGFILYGWRKKINKLTLLMTPNFQGLLKIEDLFIEETKLTGVNQNSKLIFKNIDFKHLNLIDFTNFNDISFLKCQGGNDSSLIMVNTDLGQTKFNNFSFNSFDKIGVEDSSIDKISAANVEWFSNKNLVIENENRNTFKVRREIYRQLKKALKSDGNTIDSLEFQAKELQAFKHELWEKRSFKNFGDIIILSFSWTNSYGLNWRKPLILLVIITLIFYLFIIVLISEDLSFSPNLSSSSINFTSSKLWEQKEIFFQLFDPTRKLKQVYGNINNDWLYFIDYVHRIILGLFIFQTIKAFRKYFIK